MSSVKKHWWVSLLYLRDEYGQVVLDKRVGVDDNLTNHTRIIFRDFKKLPKKIMSWLKCAKLEVLSVHKV